MTAMAEENRTQHGGSNVDDPVQAAIYYGVDVAQFRDNLALTVSERLRRHQIALSTVEMLRKARRL